MSAEGTGVRGVPPPSQEILKFRSWDGLFPAFNIEGQLQVVSCLLHNLQFQLFQKYILSTKVLHRKLYFTSHTGNKKQGRFHFNFYLSARKPPEHLPQQRQLKSDRKKRGSQFSENQSKCCGIHIIIMIVTKTLMIIIF